MSNSKAQMDPAFTSAPATTCVLSRHMSNWGADKAREFLLALYHGMKLNHAEWNALLHLPRQFCINRDMRGFVIINGEMKEHMGRWVTDDEGCERFIRTNTPVGVVKHTPAAYINGAMKAAQWISALRGKKAERGDRVVANWAGCPRFGRVVRVVKDAQGRRCLRIELDDDQARCPRYACGTYRGYILTECPEEWCAILAA